MKRISQVKSFVKLNMEAMRRRQERPLMIWMLARALSRGCPWIHTKEIREFVEAHDLCHRQTVWQAIQDGMGTLFRHEIEGRLHCRGAREIADLWGVELTEHPVFLPIDRLSSLAGIRRAMVVSFVTNKEPMIAVAKFAELVRRTPRWARRYLTQPDIEKQFKVMVSERPPPPFAQAIDPELAGQGYHRAKINGQRRLVKHLPNRYRGHFVTAPYGIVKHPTAASSLTKGQRPQGDVRRVFYDRPKAQPRAVNRLQDGETVFLAQGETKDCWGRQCWHGWTRRWGVVGRC